MAGEASTYSIDVVLRTQPRAVKRYHGGYNFTISERENHLRGVGKPGRKNQRHRRVHDHHPATAKALRSQLPGHLDWAVRDIVCGVLLCVLPANMERTDHPLAAAAHLPNDHHINQKSAGLVLRAESDQQHERAERAPGGEEKDSGKSYGKGNVQGGVGHTEQIRRQIAQNANADDEWTITNEGSPTDDGDSEGSRPYENLPWTTVRSSSTTDDTDAVTDAAQHSDRVQCQYEATNSGHAEFLLPIAICWSHATTHWNGAPIDALPADTLSHHQPQPEGGP